MYYLPKAIVVEDFYRVVPQQQIKYMIDTTNEKNGKVYHNEELVSGVTDIKICPFDGLSLASPALCEYISKQLGETLTSFIFRVPYGKGLAVNIDFAKYCNEHGIESIKDIWGEEHSPNDIELILTRSAWKGEKYFNKFGDYRDWLDYIQQCEKYDYGIGVTKWQKNFDEEPIYTRANYQILQDLKLTKEEFLSLADYSKAWGEHIAKGLSDAVWNFTGLTYKVSSSNKVLSPNTDDPIFKAMLKNPVVLGDRHIRRHIQSLADKYFQDFCCGKLWMRGAFKFILPDPIALLQHITGQEVVGSLKAGECFSQNGVDGYFDGTTILERNPHIARSEHCVLNAVGNREKELLEYCGHLSNVIIINSYDTTLPRLSGADADGDIVFVMQGKDNQTFLKGIDTSLPVVINLDEKATAKKGPINNDALIFDFVFGSDNRIGEYSNCATKWYNKMPPEKHKDGTPLSEEEKDAFFRKVEDYASLIAIVNAKEIDSAKTHIRVNLPYHIQKTAGYYPYFMRYAGDYYAKHSKLSKAPSNMNTLCFKMEDWKQRLQWEKVNKDFDWHIYLNPNIEKNEERFKALEEIYKEYKQRRKVIERAKKQDMMRFKAKWTKKNKKAGRPDARIPMHLYKYDAAYEYNRIDNEIIEQAKLAVPSHSERANYAVELCYTNPLAKKNFAWLVAGDAIARNIKQVEHTIPLEVYGKDFDFEYLGRKYIWATYPNAITPEEKQLPDNEDWWRSMYYISIDDSEGGEHIKFICRRCDNVVSDQIYTDGDIEIELPHKCPFCGKGMEVGNDNI